MKTRYVFYKKSLSNLNLALLLIVCSESYLTKTVKLSPFSILLTLNKLIHTPQEMKYKKRIAPQFVGINREVAITKEVARTHNFQTKLINPQNWKPICQRKSYVDEVCSYVLSNDIIYESMLSSFFHRSRECVVIK